METTTSLDLAEDVHILRAQVVTSPDCDRTMMSINPLNKCCVCFIFLNKHEFQAAETGGGLTSVKEQVIIR